MVLNEFSRFKLREIEMTLNSIALLVTLVCEKKFLLFIPHHLTQINKRGKQMFENLAFIYYLYYLLFYNKCTHLCKS